ncbi:LysE family translocator [Rhizobium sp. CECT 9324]|uniref:LysE family translocator n=1 Tax=Rhizobium sp. CECT 9324 TaxID=2845820 RepID=UPI001E497A0B|nr:LysE family translocator [Rhizobium sp. CECT 9324]CAH0341307.1 Homoserine/homoserine lactone efflux protein [Rhizobium sp. CECT 9324]
MSYETWFAFAAASVVLLAIPGPSMLLVISYALGYGRKTAFATVTGVALGHLVAMTAAVVGLAALLIGSATAFAVVKWIGAAYLLLMAINLWRAPAGKVPVADNDNLPQDKPLKIVAHCFAVTAGDAKNIAILVAFLPQFMTATLPISDQVYALISTYVALSTVVAAAYALIAGKALKYIRKRSVRRAKKHGNGTVLIAAGSVTAGYRKIAA